MGCGEGKFDDRANYDAQGDARSAPNRLYHRAESEMEFNVQPAIRADVGQADSGPIDLQHFLCARPYELGRAANWYGNSSRATDDGNAHCLYARRSEAVWRRFSL